jgi:predicted O-methyltransferase YrrM
MKDNIFFDIPARYDRIAESTRLLDFNMASDLFTGSLLKTLVASKPSGTFLELGTGSGLATSWILDGMDKNSKLVTIENNKLLQDIAKQHLSDERIKYDLFEETIALVRKGGIYVIDDMVPQPNWPDGHAERVEQFISALEKRNDLALTKMNWSTGIIIVTKTASQETA